MSLTDRVAQLHPQAPASLFVAFYDSQGDGGSMLTRLHMGQVSGIVIIIIIIIFLFFYLLTKLHSSSKANYKISTNKDRNKRIHGHKQG
jgi:uncharacterized membrane protein